MLKIPIKVARSHQNVVIWRCQPFSSAHLAQPLQKENYTQTAWENAKPYSSIPGPSIFQLITRSLPGGKYYGLEMNQMNKKFQEEYGKIAKLPGLFGNDEVIFITEPNDFETVFRNEGPWPFRRGLAVFDKFRKEIRPDVFKDMGGLVSEQGESWAKLRSIVSPIMLKPSTVNSYIPVVDEITTDFCDQMKWSRDDNNEIPADFRYDLNSWALESISLIGLNRRLNIIGRNKNPNVKALDLIKAMDDFLSISLDLEMKPSVWRYVETSKYKQVIAALNTITDTILHYIDEAIERIDKNPPSGEGRELSVFEKLLKVDKHVAVVMAIDMMAAGVDTTSSSTVHFLYHLAKNQDKQEKLRQELNNVPVDADGKLKSTSFGKVPYLRACIKEAMRLSPIIPGNGRAVSRDVVIQNYQLPKNTNFVMAGSLLSHNEEYFKEPEKFIPERWLNEKLPDACPASKSTNPFVYLPFGFGPRACIGKRIAEMEVSVLATRLLKQFRLEYNYGPIKSRNGLVLSPVSDLKFKLTEI